MRSSLVLILCAVGGAARADAGPGTVAVEAADATLSRALVAALEGSEVEVVAPGDEARTIVQLRRADDGSLRLSIAAAGAPPVTRAARGVAEAAALVEVLGSAPPRRRGPLERVSDAGRTVAVVPEAVVRPGLPALWGARVELHQPFELAPIGPLAVVVQLRGARGVYRAPPGAVAEAISHDELGAAIGVAARWVLLGPLGAEASVMGGARWSRVAGEREQCPSTQGCALGAFLPGLAPAIAVTPAADGAIGLALELWSGVALEASAALGWAAVDPEAAIYEAPSPLAVRLGLGVRAELP